jgi:aryl-alcohol dehydrogenase-like predicted oxidoreductase
MTTRRLGHSDISIAPLVLGTNVMGWTADEKASFAVLDAFVGEGFTAIDTADVYSRWVPGNDSESERIIGRWLKARGHRSKVHVFTKVGSDMGENRKGLSARWITEAVEGSLRRLQTDYIDLYQSHRPDPSVTQEETLTAYAGLIKAGKVRFIGASNYDETLLKEACTLAAGGLPRYHTLQNEYNLHTREPHESGLQKFIVSEEISDIPYYSLASGFLSGKYRSEADAGKSARGKGIVAKYLDARGVRILAALDVVAKNTGSAHSEIALAWLNAQPGMGAPIASATSVAQLESLARGARLTLGAEDLNRLTEAGK